MFLVHKLKALVSPGRWWRRYEVEGVFVGMSVLLGRRGVEQAVEVQLSPGQRGIPQASGRGVKEGIGGWQGWHKQGCVATTASGSQGLVALRSSSTVEREKDLHPSTEVTQ